MGWLLGVAILAQAGKDCGADGPIVVRFRYWREDDSKPKELEQALMKIKGVESVTLHLQRRRGEAKFKGSCRELASFEKNGVVLVSHAATSFTLQAGKGASLDKLKKELGNVAGLRHPAVSREKVDAFCDLDALDLPRLREAASSAGFELAPKSHRFVEVEVSAGEPSKLVRELLGVKDALVVEAAGARIAVWGVKDLEDAAIKRAADRAKVVAVVK